MEDMGVGDMFVQATQTRPLSVVNGSYTYFADGDVLLAKITPCFENGKLGIAKELTNGIGFGSSEYIVFRPNTKISEKWLYYYLSREAFRLEGAARMSGAVGHKRVSKDFIESYPVPVPALLEQQRIVGILDEAFAGLDDVQTKAERNLRNARALFQSVLSQAVIGESTKEWRENQATEKISDSLNELLRQIKGSGRKHFRIEETTGHEAITNALPKEWGLTSIGALFNLIDYRGKNPPRSEGGRRLITAKNIKMGYVSDEPITFISEETYKKWMVRGFPKLGISSL